ncbi:MAG TPA: endonuclease/exonuclease/phosphatase [Peptococcaceae bacterium]|nr:MAG: Endonuclease/exonuclease/phosphatase [Clostridia bacterium 41_269]HBT20619.1 endonuclease/exonuclease/phosphatase [Peptococcaceae bacterium]
MALCVITWNIKAGKNPDGSCPIPRTANLDKMAKVIKNSGASIASLQEVDACTARSGSIHQAEYIASRLSMLTGKKWFYRYITSIKMNPGYYGNAIISMYPLTTALRVLLPKVNSFENRSFLLVRTDFDNGYLYAGTFHLGLKGDQSVQAQLIKDLLNKRGYSNEKLIIGGDLNDDENSKPYSIMLHNAFPMTDAGPRGMGTLQCFKNPNSPKIDFWFVRGVSVDTSKSRVIQIDISDHRPVVVCIKV